MKKLIFLILFMLCFAVVHAQERHTLDSLKNLLARAKPDTNKVLLYMALADQYVWSYPDSCLQYTGPGLQLANKLGFEKGKFDLLGHRTYALSGRGNFPQALNEGFNELQLAERIGNAEYHASALILLANVYNDAQDYANALKYYQKFRSSASPVFFKQWEWLFTNGVGTVYLSENKLDSALFYENRTYYIIHNGGAKWPPPSIALSKIYGKLRNYKKAIYFALEAVRLSYYKDDQSSARYVLADAYYHTGKGDSAIYYAKKSLAISLSASFKQVVPDPAGLLSRIYKEKHLPDSALKFEDIMLAAKDSLFSRDKDIQLQNIAFTEQERQQTAIEKETQYRNRAMTAGLLLVIAATLIIVFVVWRGSKQKQKANLLLNEQKEEIAAQRDNLEQALSELQTTQSQLIQREKMASLGELTAGIAHEIQNPLNFVNNFSEVNREMLEELKAETCLPAGRAQKPRAEWDEHLVIELINNLIENEQKINHHGKRADFIVKGMLEHSRKSTGEKQLTDINVLCDEFLKLSYHGLRAKDKSFNAEMVTNFDSNLPKVNVSQQDIGRVMLNLFNNAFYAVNQKAKTAGADYKPTVELSTAASNDHIEIRVKDNGPGIPENIKDKIMQPFFTTKPTGEGTGLGLSISYDIIKAHGGEIQIKSEENSFSEFKIILPIN